MKKLSPALLCTLVACTSSTTLDASTLIDTGTCGDAACGPVAGYLDRCRDQVSCDDSLGCYQGLVSFCSTHCSSAAECPGDRGVATVCAPLPSSTTSGTWCVHPCTTDADCGSGRWCDSADFNAGQAFCTPLPRR